MAACENIDITQDQTTEILQTIYVMLSTNVPPYTIVDYVCATVDIPSPNIPAPEVSATNWCLLTCISSCLYRHTYFTQPSTYTYFNKPETYTCLTSCFPIFPGESSSSGGGGAPADSPAAENLDKWNAEHQKNVLDQLKSGIVWLQDILDRAFSNLAITCGSFAVWIAMLAEHYSEVTIANISKKIGAAIDWIAKAIKAGADILNGYATQAKAYLTGATDTNAGHLHPTLKQLGHATQHAMTSIKGFLTDIMKNAGQYMEQIGDFLKDMADRMWDLKEIAFAAAALAAMIKEIISLIEWTFKRIKEIIKAAKKVIENIKDKYIDQAKNKVKEKVNIEKINGMIEPTSNNKSPSMVSKAVSMISAKAGVSTS